MTFSLNGLIDTASFNDLAANASPGSSVNSLFNTGSGKFGYGQADPIANVAVGNSITSTLWSSLNNRIIAMGNHQSSALVALPTTAVGDSIKYSANYLNDLATLKTNSFNAAAQGTTTSTTTTATVPWSNTCTFTHTITFPSGDSARYFFNCGGQLKFSFTATYGPSNTGDYVMHYLGQDVGTVVLSAPSTGTCNIAVFAYNGITQTGTTIKAPTIDPNKGYYGLTTSYSTVLKQFARFGLNTYLGSFLKVDMKTNGPVGSNQDNGTTITVQTVWDEVPNGLTVSPGTAVTCTVVPPSTTYLAKSWGTPTVVGTFVAV